MDKNQVMETLGVTERTVRRYVKSGKLKVVYINGKGFYNEAEVMRLKEELETPVHHAIVDNATITNLDVENEVLFKLVTMLLQSIEQKRDRLTHLKDLERCARNNWLLPSAVLKDLVNLKKLPSSPFFKYGFVFERRGRQWQVSKLSSFYLDEHAPDPTPQRP